jgi:hypothetical protein
MDLRLPPFLFRSLLLMLTLGQSFAHASGSTVHAQSHAAVSAVEAAGLFCTMDHLSEGIRWVENQSNDRDKFKHCAVSCYLTLRCSAIEVMAVGALKEFKDLFDEGNAEIADLEADRLGIRLVTNGKADHDRECARRCEQHYPKP